MKQEQIKTLLVNIIVVVVVVGALAAVYFVFINKSTDSSIGVRPLGETAQSTANIGTEITTKVTILKALEKSVKDSAEIFSLTSFGSLEDFSSDISPDTGRRDNPFVPTDWKLRNMRTLNESSGTVQPALSINQQATTTTTVEGAPKAQGALLGDFNSANPPGL